MSDFFGGSNGLQRLGLILSSLNPQSQGATMNLMAVQQQMQEQQRRQQQEQAAQQYLNAQPGGIDPLLFRALGPQRALEMQIQRNQPQYDKLGLNEVMMERGTGKVIARGPTAPEPYRDPGNLITLVSPKGEVWTGGEKTPQAQQLGASGWMVREKDATKPKSVVEMYQGAFGPLQQGMMPEIVNGALTGRQVFQPGGQFDPSVIEAQKTTKLAEELPKAEKSMQTALLPLENFITEINAVRKDPNTKDVVGPYEGRTSGGILGRFGGENTSASSRIDRLKALSESIGLNLTRSGGVAPGSITEREWPKFSALVANLDPRLEEKDFFGQLDEAEKTAKTLMDAIKADFNQTYSRVRPQQQQPQSAVDQAIKRANPTSGWSIQRMP